MDFPGFLSRVPVGYTGESQTEKHQQDGPNTDKHEQAAYDYDDDVGDDDCSKQSSNSGGLHYTPPKPTTIGTHSSAEEWRLFHKLSVLRPIFLTEEQEVIVKQPPPFILHVAHGGDFGIDCGSEKVRLLNKKIEAENLVFKKAQLAKKEQARVKEVLARRKVILAEFRAHARDNITSALSRREPFAVRRLKEYLQLQQNELEVAAKTAQHNNVPCVVQKALSPVTKMASAEAHVAAVELFSSLKRAQVSNVCSLKNSTQRPKTAPAAAAIEFGLSKKSSCFSRLPQQTNTLNKANVSNFDAKQKRRRSSNASSLRSDCLYDSREMVFSQLDEFENRVKNNHQTVWETESNESSSSEFS